MLKKLINQLTPIIAIDAGTQRTRIWSNTLLNEDSDLDQSEVIDRATCLAIEKNTGKVIQVGDEAQVMEGRVGSDIEVVHPIRRGEVVDSLQFKAFLQLLLSKIVSPITLSRPVMLIAVPSTLSVAKREQLSNSLYDLGAQEVYTINQSLASAIGSGVPIADATGSFMMQCGAGIIEASVISLGSSVANDTTWFAGHWFDEYIQAHFRQSFGLIISKETAIKIKSTMVQIGISESNQEFLVSGQDLSTASPREISINEEDLQAPVQLFAHQFELLLKRLLANLPPELSVDVIDKGLLLSGGLAQLRGLEDFLRVSLGVPVATVEHPTLTVIQGLKTALQHIDEFKQSLGYRQ
jgi:rod shape-determining protein MreB and related proteins